MWFNRSKKNKNFELTEILCIGKNKGFTLAEMLIVVIIIGILSAIVAPNFFNWFTRYKIEEGLGEIKGALKEGQKQAMRQGIRCRIRINTATNTITGNPPRCLLSDRDLRDDISITTNFGSPSSFPTTFQLSFSYKGNYAGIGGKIVVSDVNSSQNRKCLVMTNGLGIMRTGNYQGDIDRSSSITAGTCTRP